VARWRRWQPRWTGPKKLVELGDFCCLDAS
jgi:hypothetical protein